MYERIKASKRDESFSDAVSRLIGGRSLRDLRGVFDEDQVSEMRDAIETADQRAREEGDSALPIQLNSASSDTFSSETAVR